jgi:hypothetical protein
VPAQWRWNSETPTSPHHSNFYPAWIHMTRSSSESVADSLYTDLETELATTRRMLERFPSGKSEWRPHEKSMTLGSLASHPVPGSYGPSADEPV